MATGRRPPYCPSDRTIAYDVEFVTGVVGQNGEHAALAVLAHEWGHHVQHLRGGGGTYTLQKELEADCLAALYLASLEAEGQIDPIPDGVVSFYRLGDSGYAESAWFDANEHGTPNQRVAAFGLGYLAVENGLRYCEGYRAWQPQTRVSFGPVSLSGIPGHNGLGEDLCTRRAGGEPEPTRLPLHL